jgi:hypothetical protein
MIPLDPVWRKPMTLDQFPENEIWAMIASIQSSPEAFDDSPEVTMARLNELIAEVNLRLMRELGWTETRLDS